MENIYYKLTKEWNHRNIPPTIITTNGMCNFEKVFHSAMCTHIYEDQHTYFNMLYDVILSGNILMDGNIYKPHQHIKTILKQHQQRIVHHMIELEHNNYIYTNHINYGILCDKVGSGKSLSILSTISDTPLLTIPTETIYHTQYPISHSQFHTLDISNGSYIPTNLIVVPHNIYNQWMRYLIEHTEFSFFGIHNRKQIKEWVLKDSLETITIVKSTMIKEFMKQVFQKYGSYSIVEKNNKIVSKDIIEDYCGEVMKSIMHMYTSNSIDGILQLEDVFEKTSHKINHDMQILKSYGKYIVDLVYTLRGPVFSRVIIDEIDSIDIPNCPQMYGVFQWYITSSIKHLFFGNNYHSNRGFIYSRLYDLQTNKYNCVNSIQHIVLRNIDKFVDDSFKMEEPITHTIPCRTHYSIEILQGIANKELIRALNAGDIDSAYDTLENQIGTEEEIVDCVVQSLYDKIKQANDTIDNKRQLILTLDTQINIPHQYQLIIKNYKIAKQSALDSIKNIQEKIIKHNTEIANIIERIRNKNCPICQMDITNMCILPCCNHSFCVECIIKSFNYSNKCPICRSHTTAQQIKIMSPAEEVSNEKKSKLETLVDIIKSKPNSTFIVCCQFEKVFSNQIKEQFHKYNISFSMLKGSSNHIQNTIDNFKTNKVRVLLLNPKYYGSGLNLEMCTDIIIMHQMEQDIYTQVIGRAQRPNRKSVLEIYRLCNTNEL